MTDFSSSPLPNIEADRRNVERRVVDLERRLELVERGQQETAQSIAIIKERQESQSRLMDLRFGGLEERVNTLTAEWRMFNTKLQAALDNSNDSPAGRELNSRIAVIAREVEVFQGQLSAYEAQRDRDRDEWRAQREQDRKDREADHDEWKEFVGALSLLKKVSWSSVIIWLATLVGLVAMALKANF